MTLAVTYLKNGFLVMAGVGIIGAFVAIFIMNASTTEQVEKRKDYLPTVAQAITEDYGLNLDEASVAQLIEGEPASAEVNNEQLLVSLREDTRGVWRLYSNGAALPLLNDEASALESE